MVCPPGQVEFEDGSCGAPYTPGQMPMAPKARELPPPGIRPAGQMDPAIGWIMDSLARGAATARRAGPLKGLFGGGSGETPPQVQYPIPPTAAPTPDTGVDIRYTGFDDFNRRKKVT